APKLTIPTLRLRAAANGCASNQLGSRRQDGGKGAGRYGSLNVSRRHAETSGGTPAMQNRTRLHGLLVLAIGALLGYGAASGKLVRLVSAGDEKPNASGGLPAEPGSPTATTTIDGKQLPPPPAKFGGKIERVAANSQPYWPARVTPKKGA